jgi:hypothetical protein
VTIDLPFQVPRTISRLEAFPQEELFRQRVHPKEEAASRRVKETALYDLQLDFQNLLQLVLVQRMKDNDLARKAGNHSPISKAIENVIGTAGCPC